MATIESSLIASEQSPTPRYRVGARWFLRRVFRKRSAQIGGAIVLVLVLAALLGQWFTPYDPFKIQTDIRLQPPSWQHVMGTDEQGRDLLSRIIYGARYTLMIGVVAVSVAAVPGIFVGLLCAYYGGLLDLLLMRLIDIMLSFPYILLTLAVVAMLGPSLTNAMIAVGIAGIPSYARLVRGSALSVKEEEYVTAERALGASNWRIMMRSIFPNVLSPIVVFVSLDMPTAVLSAAALSFLGLGAQPPIPEWGAMMVNARTFVVSAPWVVMAPGISIFVAILGMNLLGNALRDVMDPRAG